MFPSYRNQSVDSLCISTDWFLYDGSIGRFRVQLEDLKVKANTWIKQDDLDNVD